MKRFFSVAFFLLTLGLAVFGQTTKSDLEQLRKEVGLPPSVSINDRGVSFPQSKPTKIYLAIKYSKSSAKDFKDWAARWNKTNAAQFGEIQIVDNLDDADIAAVQYRFGTGRVVREDSIQMKTGKTASQDGVDKISGSDRTTLSGIGTSSVRAKSEVKDLKVPIYSYLIVREQDSSWAVDFSRVDDRFSNENFPDRLLRSAIESRLKER